MEIRHLDIPGLIEFIPVAYMDARGKFLETFRQDVLMKMGINITFVQDNQSFSKKDVLRGIHFQKTPYEQGKLVHVVSGSALDVAVDLRPESEFFGRYQSIILDSDLNNIFYIPEGFGHGFLALEDCILQYKCTKYYNPQADSGIVWNDPELKIKWGIKNPILSEKDAKLPPFKSFKLKME